MNTMSNNSNKKANIPIYLKEGRKIPKRNSNSYNNVSRKKLKMPWQNGKQIKRQTTVYKTHLKTEQYEG